MIYTRWGVTVTVLGMDPETGMIRARRSDGVERHYYLFELVADGGTAEIRAAIAAARDRPAGEGAKP